VTLILLYQEITHTIITYNISHHTDHPVYMSHRWSPCDNNYQEHTLYTCAWPDTSVKPKYCYIDSITYFTVNGTLHWSGYIRQLSDCQITASPD